MKGSVTNKKARNTATGVLAQLTPSGLDGKRDVDDHLEHLLAGKVIADQYPGDCGAHEDIDNRDKNRLPDSEPECGQRLRAAQGIPVSRPATLGSLNEHRGQRDQHEQAEPQQCNAKSQP